MEHPFQKFVSYMLGRGSHLIGTDLSYAVRGGFWLTTAQIVTALAGLGLAVVFANVLPKETYGVYRFVLSGAALFSATSFSGLNTALIRSVARQNYASYLPIFYERIKWSALGSAGALVAALYYFLNDNHTLSISFLIVAVFTPFLDSLNVYTAFRSGLKHFRYSALSDIIIRVVGVAALVSAVLVTNNILFLVLIYFSAYTLLRSIFFLHTAEYVKKLSPVQEKDPDVLAYGRHLSIMYFLSALAAQVDKIVIFHFAGAAALAAYAFATVIPDQLRTSIKNITVLAFPKYSAHAFTDVLAGLSKKNLFVSLGTAAVIVLYVLIAPYLFRLMFPSYSESILLTQLLALTLVDAFTLLPLSALKAHQQTRLLYRYHIIVGAIQILLIATGGAYAGIYGVVVGLIVGRVFAVAYSSFLVFSLRVNMH